MKDGFQQFDRDANKRTDARLQALNYLCVSGVNRWERRHWAHGSELVWAWQGARCIPTRNEYIIFIWVERLLQKKENWKFITFGCRKKLMRD